jgi:hypothetical protein
MFPDTQANNPKVRTIMAEEPAARPSIPSVKFAPLDTAVTINITIGININQDLSRLLNLHNQTHYL